MSKYEIKVLTNEDFDKVAKSDPRYSYVGDDTLGFADRETNTAYVRYSSEPELQKFLINHELEELVESDSAHEDPNGIRHKGFGSIFGGIARAVSSIFGGGGGNPLSSIFGGGRSSAAETGGAPLNVTFGGGGGGGPLGAFSTGEAASGRVPSSISTGSTGGGSDQGGLGEGGLQPIDPALAERTKGFLSNRQQF